MNDLKYFFNTIDERFEKVLKCQMADIFFFATQLMKDLKQFLDIRWQQIFAPNLTFPKVVLPNWPRGEPCFILTHTQGTLFYTSNYRHALKDTAQLDNDTLTH